MHIADVETALVDVPAAQGYLALRTERGDRAYLLGPRTALDASPPMLDWRTAPLAEAFFRAAPGEPFELEIGEHVTSGTVTARFVVAEHGRALIGDETVWHQHDGGWREDRVARPAAPAGPPIDRSELPILDPEQQRAVDLPADTSLVVDGEAGVGKTLVALYRIAALERRARAKGKRFRALVLVPTEGLRRLCRLIADRLGLPKLEIAVFETWLVARAHQAFPGLPKRLSEGATAQVIALKRHPALRTVLDDFIGWKPPKDDEKLARSRARLLHLFGDRDRLARVVEAAGGALPERAIAATMKHTRIQFETTTERAHAHVDADRLVALDGRRLDAGTPTEDVHTFDFEDAAVLFELVRRGALPEAALPHYEHIFIDEAQLRSPLELAAVGDALARGGTVTLAGDHRQATDESAFFAGWAAARTEVRAQRWAEVTLAITYRSVPAIGDFARAVSEGRAALPSSPPTDPAVWATACGGQLAQAAALCWHLDALLTRDPWRQIAVIARTPEHARRLYAELSRGLDPTLVLDGDFRFEPGIIVTTAAAVSGLEFDSVVVPDLSAAFYPSDELRRALYVVATRARDWLWLLTPEQWSPLVQPASAPA
ncbi:MAG TPA: ATP-binding domain-containing protein [Kofleriaceae bacterium]|nr:ATP-binding domain-containing protein [Kofleriaceae bacterium]